MRQSHIIKKDNIYYLNFFLLNYNGSWEGFFSRWSALYGVSDSFADYPYGFVYLFFLSLFFFFSPCFPYLSLSFCFLFFAFLSLLCI